MNLRPIFIYFFEKPGFGAEIAGFFKKYAALSERRKNRALKSTQPPEFQLVSERHQKTGALFHYRKYYAYVQNTTCPKNDVKVADSYFCTPCFLRDNRSDMAVKLRESQNINLSRLCCKNGRIFAKTARIRKYRREIQQVRDMPKKKRSPRFSP